MARLTLPRHAALVGAASLSFGRMAFGQGTAPAPIQGRSGALGVMLKDLAGATLWQCTLEPKRG